MTHPLLASPFTPLTYHDKLLKEHLGDRVVHADGAVHDLSHQTGQGDHSLDSTDEERRGKGGMEGDRGRERLEEEKQMKS